MLTNINLSSLTAQDGFYITGEVNSQSGFSVASAGDFNGDGISDIIIGAPYNKDVSGRTYVIYGKTGGLTNINLSSLTAQDGFYITGEVNSQSGWSVASAGDVNGDGIADIIISQSSSFSKYNISPSTW